MHMPRLSARRARSVATAKASATSGKPARPIADDATVADGTSASERGREGEHDRDRVRPCSVCQSVIQSEPLHTGWPREAY